LRIFFKLLYLVLRLSLVAFLCISPIHMSPRDFHHSILFVSNNVIYIYLILHIYMSAFRPRGSLDRRVNCRCVPQPRWVGARRNTRRENRGFVLSCAQGGCACSRGLQASARERERACSSARPPVRPPPRTRALDLPFIDVRRGSRCTMGV
jgi:hypothetical protein